MRHEVKLNSPDEIQTAIERITAGRAQSPLEAIQMASGKPSLVAVFTLVNGQLALNRFANNFHHDDMPVAMKMLRDDLAKEAPWKFEENPC